MLAMPSNLLAHHLHVLEQAGIITRRRSEGDRRRTYLQLVPGALESLAAPPARAAPRVLFVCTANSARSHLAAALWRQASTVPAVSAGTHPAAAIDPGAIAAARRHRLPLPRLRPRHISDVRHDGDLVITVCDLAHEELAAATAVHWSIPDPVPGRATRRSFDAALAQLADRSGASRRAWRPSPDPAEPGPGPGLAHRSCGGGLDGPDDAECMPGAASWVKVTDASVNPAAASPSRYSARDRAPAMQPA